jgi:hypothetical protein
MKYKYIQKSNSELKHDEIIDDLCRKLWKDSGYATAFYLGSLTQLKYMAKPMREEHYLSKKNILALIGTYKDNKDVPDEIKELADMILEEFDYKENNNASNI